MIKLKKLRQSAMNESGFLQKENSENMNKNNQNYSDENFNPALDRMFPLETNIDLDNINTSTFGYAIQHNNRATQSKMSENSPLKNSHGVLSTVNSKMSKRYMTNQLTESDSSIGEDIIQGKLLTKFML